MIRPLLTVLIFSVAFLMTQVRVARGQGPEVLVIEGGTLIDGNGGQPIQDALIIMRGNRIESVSRKGQTTLPAGAQVLRADGKFIVPGLMDAHAHYSGYMAEMYVNHGVTSVFQIGGGGRAGLMEREAINRGKIPGPRLFMAATSLEGERIIAIRRGQAGLRSGEAIRTAEQARAKAIRNVEMGADMIKIHRGPPLEAHRAAIEEAHKAGLPVVVQPLGPTVWAREAVMAGADILEHAAGVGYSIVRDPSKWADWGGIEAHSLDPTIYVDMDEGKAADLIQEMVRRNVYLEPDFVCKGRSLFTGPEKAAEYELLDHRLLILPALAYVPRERVMKWRKIYHEFDDWSQADRDRRQQGLLNYMRFIRRFATAGGKVMVGTDVSSWAVPGIGVHHEMDMFAQAGFSPMEVIVAATRTVAEGFRILDRVGTIEPGKFADLVVVNENPLSDINHLREIEWVIRDGRVVDRTYHAHYDPVFAGLGVERRGVAEKLQEQTFQKDPTWAFGWPAPSILSISPDVVTEGDPTVTVKVGGAHFTKHSLARFDGKPVPSRFVSETELDVTIEANRITRPGTYPITVTNPEPVQRSEWGGGTSNPARMIVNFRY